MTLEEPEVRVQLAAGRRVLLRRRLLGLSRREVAWLAGIEHTTYCGVETGPWTPELKRCLCLAVALETTVDELVGWAPLDYPVFPLRSEPAGWCLRHLRIVRGLSRERLALLVRKAGGDLGRQDRRLDPRLQLSTAKVLARVLQLSLDGLARALAPPLTVVRVEARLEELARSELETP